MPKETICIHVTSRVFIKKITNKTVTAISNKRQIVKYTKSEHASNSPMDKICGNKTLAKRENNTLKVILT